MWNELKRITKDNGAICLFGSEPFSSHLRLSNLKMFKYDWIWEKASSPNFFVAKLQPLNPFENISVFSAAIANQGKKEKMRYFPQGITKNETIRKNSKNVGGLATHIGKGDNNCFAPGKEYLQEFSNYPVRKISVKQEKGLHPTQKPVALLEYLIKTYTLENETVLDFTMGSGSTGVACKNLNRKFIGIEKDEHYFKVAQKRILGDGNDN